MTETNYVASGSTKEVRKMDIQEVKPQKPMSIDEYIKALRKEAEVAKLRASIAEAMFKENLNMVQLRQLQAGIIGGPQPGITAPPEVDNEMSQGDSLDSETTQVD